MNADAIPKASKLGKALEAADKAADRLIAAYDRVERANLAYAAIVARRPACWPKAK